MIQLMNKRNRIEILRFYDNLEDLYSTFILNCEKNEVENNYMILSELSTSFSEEENVPIEPILLAESNEMMF